MKKLIYCRNLGEWLGPESPEKKRMETEFTFRSFILSIDGSNSSGEPNKWNTSWEGSQYCYQCVISWSPSWVARVGPDALSEAMWTEPQVGWKKGTFWFLAPVNILHAANQRPSRSIRIPYESTGNKKPQNTESCVVHHVPQGGPVKNWVTQLGLEVMEWEMLGTQGQLVWPNYGMLTDRLKQLQELELGLRLWLSE